MTHPLLRHLQNRQLSAAWDVFSVLALCVAFGELSSLYAGVPDAFYFGTFGLAIAGLATRRLKAAPALVLALFAFLMWNHPDHPLRTVRLNPYGTTGDLVLIAALLLYLAAGQRSLSARSDKGWAGATPKMVALLIGLAVLCGWSAASLLAFRPWVNWIERYVKVSATLAQTIALIGALGAVFSLASLVGWYQRLRRADDLEARATLNDLVWHPHRRELRRMARARPPAGE